MDQNQNTVSWQSAFWALVPLALNSMAQPASLVLGTPSKHGYLLRVSPVVCALDALHFLICLMCYTASLKDPRAAVELVTKHRYRESGDGDIARLQQSWVLRSAILLFGALPQIVKLYGMRGVPWTTAWGSLYIGSFRHFRATGAKPAKERQRHRSARCWSCKQRP